MTFRDFTAQVVGTILKATGSEFRFSKCYRHGVSLKHRIVYALVNTVRANRVAGL